MAVPKVKLKNGKTVCLGRIKPKKIEEFDGRLVVTSPKGKKYVVVQLGNHYDPDNVEAQPPDEFDLSEKATKSIHRMYLNDRLGDCVIASKYHAMGAMSMGDESEEVFGTDKEVEQMYHRICGPGDNGCVITDVMDAWQRNGLTASGRTDKIDAYVAVDWTNKELVQTAIYVFGNLTLGIDLPSDWTCTDCVWDVSNGRIVGGHDVQCVGYDGDGVKIATWGGIATITWKAFLSKKWLGEAYVALAPDWYGKDNVGGTGIDVEELKKDIGEIGQGNTPPVPDPKPPTPPPPPPPPPPPGPNPTPGPSPFVLFLEMLLAELLAVPNLSPSLQKILQWILSLLQRFEERLKENEC